MDIKVAKLKKARSENLLRLALARALRLNTTGMSHNQVARLIRWRITRPVIRFADPVKRTDYAAMWENL